MMLDMIGANRYAPCPCPRGLGMCAPHQAREAKEGACKPYRLHEASKFGAWLGKGGLAQCAPVKVCELLKEVQLAGAQEGLGRGDGLQPN